MVCFYLRLYLSPISVIDLVNSSSPEGVTLIDAVSSKKIGFPLKQDDPF